ncbi:MAG: ATP-binding cassette domain-containing protein [Nocardioidaceae bacterium]
MSHLPVTGDPDSIGRPLQAGLVLEAAGVTFGYPGHAPLLNDWSARFRPGTMTAISGPSGRGKSTLLFLLGLMLRPQAGEIRLDGIAASGLSDRERAAWRAGAFGFVFQDAALDPTRSVLDNVTEAALYRGVGRRSLRLTALELLRDFEVEVDAERRPGQISGGQAQRVGLCRALIGNPKVLLADEPTGNLDPASADVVLRGMRAHADGGATVVVVTHTAAVIDACDHEVRL